MNGIKKQVIVTLGEPVTANQMAGEFNLTPDKEYLVKGYDGDCIMVCDNNGNDLWFSLDYFKEFARRFDD